MREYIGGDDLPNRDLKKSKWSKFVDDLPIYLNGFAVGYITFGKKDVGLDELIMFAIAAISFGWYGSIQRRK